MTVLDERRFPAPISRTYPINVVLRGHSCLVVGGGRVGERKVRGLQWAQAHVTVVAPEVTPELAADDTIVWRERAYRSSDISGHRLVVAATGDPDVDTRVAADARAAGVLVNAADDPQNCDFILPAVVHTGGLTVSVSTGSRSPAVAMWLRKRLESELDWRYRELLDAASMVREQVRLQYGTSELPGWGAALDDAFAAIASGEPDIGHAVLHSTLTSLLEPVIVQRLEGHR